MIGHGQAAATAAEQAHRAGQPDARSTSVTRARYDRIAPVYDAMERLMEGRSAPYRQDLWSRVRGPRVLEVGVGTGRNIPLYPPGVQVKAIDMSPRMLELARKRVSQAATAVELLEADIQALPSPDAHFDSVVATFVFCSVPDPVLGLRELHRVLRPGGQLLLLEHVLSRKPVVRTLMNLMNPIVSRIMGANINRETVENVRRAGFVDLQVQDLAPLDIVKSISARPLDGQSDRL